MNVDGMLTIDQALRLKCIRLAIAAGNFQVAGLLYDFVKNDDRTAMLTEPKKHLSSFIAVREVSDAQ